MSPIFISQQKKKQTSGFTIVETLVAIAVLMIAVAGPLVIASKGLTAALYSKDQMIASFLAQESMEVIKNLRDSALKSGGDYLDNFNGNCEGSTKECDADPFQGNFINNANGGPDGSPIYFYPNEGYSSKNGTGKIVTPFSRYFYLEDVDGDAYQRRVHVVVTWKVGTIPFETEITGLLTGQSR